MLNERELDTKSAGKYAWFAARDARQRSLAAQSHFPLAKQAEADRVKFVLELLYSGKVFDPTYRGEWISIKIENPRVRDRQQLASMEKEWDVRGYSKVSTPQGITYRIPKV